MMAMDNRHWYDILEREVLKEGMRIRSCLDMSDLHRNEDDQVEWFEGTINSIDTNYVDGRYRGWALQIARDDEVPDPDDTWTIVLLPSTLKYIQMYFKEWDD